MRPACFIRPDDQEIFSLNKDGVTYTIHRAKKEWPDHYHHSYYEDKLRDCGFEEGTEKMIEDAEKNWNMGILPQKDENHKGLRKIRDIKPPCMHPEHNPPSHICLSPGVYEYTCPACGHTIQFTVNGFYCHSETRRGKPIFTWKDSVTEMKEVPTPYVLPNCRTWSADDFGGACCGDHL